MGDLFSQVLNMSLTGSVVILLVIFGRGLLKKFPKIYSYALWSVVLFRLLCPVSITAPVSVLQPLQPEAKEIAEGVGTVSYLPEEREIPAIVPTPVPETPEASTSEIPAQTVNQPERTPMEMASLIWSTGALVLLLYSLVSYMALRLRLVGAVNLKGNLYLADRIRTAFVLGFFRPRIYLPSDLPMEERRFIIAHERHHLRRGDHIIKWLAFLGLCVHWFNPLVWLAFVLAGKDMEMSCDEAVLRKLGSHTRGDYSAVLLRLSTGHKYIAGFPLSFGEGDPKGRIRNMAKWKKPKVWASVLCALLCIVLLIVCGVNPQKETGIKVLSRDSLESCKAALEAVQSADSCMIRSFQGQQDLSLDNYTGRSEYRKAGADWMQINATESYGEESVFAYMYRDGIYYDNVGTAGVENGHILWNASSDRNVKKPWLLSFQWDPDKVQLLDRWEDAEGTHILLQLFDTITDKNAVAEEYTAEFLFSTDKAFHQVTLRAELQEPNGSSRKLEIVMFKALWDPETIDREMEMALRSKLPPLESTIQGQTATYGSLSMTLPEGYSWQKGKGTGLLLYKNGTLAGGVTHWNTPAEDEDWINSLGLWDAMSGASYMVMFSDSQKLVTAGFTNEANREAMDHSHIFHIRGTVSYDVWFDSNQISQEEEKALRKTVSISDEAPNWEEKSLGEGSKIQDSSGMPLNLSALPRNYHFAEQENGNLSILEGNTVIGSIDAYEIPGGTMTAYDPYFRWLESLGALDYGDDSLCYMGNGSLYGDWEMHFQSDVPPGVECTVDRYHTYFVTDKMVYDVWFDMMLVNSDTKNTILSALTGQEAYMETRPPAEGSDDGTLYVDHFDSSDGTVTIDIYAYIHQEELEAEGGVSLEALLAAMEREFLATNVDDYGWDTDANGYLGAWCEVNVTELKAGTYVVSAGQEVPTLEVRGTRSYAFANGDKIGEEQGSINLLTLNALNGDILSCFGRKEPASGE